MKTARVMVRQQDAVQDQPAGRPLGYVAPMIQNSHSSDRAG